jgi:hypothetical protein
MDGARIAAQPLTSFILPEIEEDGFTIVSLTNPGPDPAELNIDLTTADGLVRATARQALGAHCAVTVDAFGDLFPNTGPDASDYIRVTANRGVVPYEITGRPGRYLRVLDGQGPSSGSRTLYSAQYVTGGTWRSALSIVNIDAAPGSISLRFVRDDAVQVGMARVLQIAPRGKILIDNPSFFVPATDGVLQGYVEILSQSVRLTGSVTLGDLERSRFSTALPLTTQLQKSIVYTHVASDEVYFTGMSIVNPHESPVTAVVDLHRPDGGVEYSTIEVIPGRQRTSRLLTEYFQGTAGRKWTGGYLTVTADREIAGLCVFGTHTLSVLSATPGQSIP